MKNNMKLTKRLGLIGALAGTALVSGCATTEGSRYTKHRDAGDMYEVIQDDQLNYNHLGESIARSMEKGTYDPNCPAAAAIEAKKIDATRFGARLCADLAKVLLAYKIYESSGSSNSFECFVGASGGIAGVLTGTSGGSTSGGATGNNYGSPNCN